MISQEVQTHHKFCFLKKSHPRGWYTAIVMEWPSLPSHVRSPASCFLYTCLSLSLFTPSFWWSTSSCSFLVNRKQIIWDLLCLKMSLFCLHIWLIVFLDRKFQGRYHFPSLHCLLVPTAVGEKAEGLSLSPSLSSSTSFSFLSFIKLTGMGCSVDLLIHGTGLSVRKLFTLQSGEIFFNYFFNDFLLPFPLFFLSRTPIA